jgi:hypothetical protein
MTLFLSLSLSLSFPLSFFLGGACLHLLPGPRLLNLTDFRHSLAPIPPGAILLSFARSADVRFYE